MATRKPISTISYNTIPYLKEKLNLWIKSHKIQSYQFIVHAAEETEKKKHIHLRIEPNASIDPMCLSEDLAEPDTEHPDRPPLGCRPWRPSKEEDWILYATHYPPYMEIKYPDGCPDGKREYPYTAVEVNDGYDLESMWIRALQSLKYMSPSLAHDIAAGRKTPIQAIYEGYAPSTVNAIYRAVVYSGEYTELLCKYEETVNENERLRKKMNAVCALVNELGYGIVDDGKSMQLIKRANGIMD